MSALSNGPMKKNEKRDGPSIYDIGSASGIAIGRGYEDQVAAQMPPPQEYMPPVAMSLPETCTSMEQLDEYIDSSSLTEEDKKATKATLREELLAELQKGEEANVLIVKQQLTDITTNLPGIRVYLRSFIDNYAETSKTIRILSHKLLD